MKLAKLLALIGLAALAAPATAAPSCMPSLTVIPVVGIMPATLNSGPYYAAWKCPDGSIHFNDFSLAEVASSIVQANAGTLTQAQAQAAYTTLNTGPAASAAMLAFAHTVWVDQGWSASAMLTTTVYKQHVERTNGVSIVTYVPFGTAPIGTPCTLIGKAGGYCVLPDRTVVKKNAPADTYPLVLYGVGG